MEKDEVDIVDIINDVISSPVRNEIESCLDEVVKYFKNNYNRKPTMDELIRVFESVIGANSGKYILTE